MKITILLFDQVDLLDAGGPYEVFLTASRLSRRDGIPEPFQVGTATLNGQMVRAYGGMGLVPDGSFSDILSDTSDGHVLIVPGTIDIDTAVANRALVEAIAEFARAGAASSECIVASVCTGAFLLGEAGLLSGAEWTTHWEDIDLLSSRLGKSGARRNLRWVDNHSVITAAGLSSGIDMALHLVHRLVGIELAQRTARQIDYQWYADGKIPQQL
ncbi:MAG: DJ-1/PfpI family protein [Granulosicoccus sp.]|nr:DJ-1/PfpI family protein [Granulosicoccus sp.]